MHKARHSTHTHTRCARVHASDGCSCHSVAGRGVVGLLVTFPSLDLGFMSEVIQALRLPARLVEFGRRLHDHTRLFWRGSHGEEVLCGVSAGLLQGNPLSSLLFVLAIDPFLRQTDVALTVRHEAARACADDLGRRRRTSAALLFSRRSSRSSDPAWRWIGTSASWSR